MDVTAKIEPGKNGCKHQRVTLTAGGKEYIRAFEESEIVGEKEFSEDALWAAALPLIRQAAKVVDDKATMADAKLTIEAGVYRI